MFGRTHRWLPVLFATLFAASRFLPLLWPQVMPPNFSMAYALAFCAGAFFPRRLAWGLPLGVFLGTDLLLNIYYHQAKGLDVFSGGSLVYLGANYLGHLALIALGRLFRPNAHYLGLLAGGLAGSVLFYFITNTASWLLNPFHNPEYTRDLSGWITALTLGTKGHPPTWEFFRNTLLSGGLFTALFAGSWKLTERESPQEKGEAAAEPAEPQEADA